MLGNNVEDAFAELIHAQSVMEKSLGIAITKETPIYQTGTWVPTLLGSGTAGTFTYTIQSGEYTRFGNRVWVVGRILITAITVAPTLDMRISGLPYTSASPASSIAGGGSPNIWHGFTIGAAYSQIGLRIINGVTYINLTKSGNNVAQANIQGAEVALVGGVLNLDWTCQYRLA